ncbi:MAG: hypothetical protein KAI24_12450, partial [Planctomycetes bacterium]|nr:hypothetical protein [Planctomycetota bacterium]
MNPAALEIARERQLDWLLDEALGGRAPATRTRGAAARPARPATPRWLVAALVLLAIGAAVGVAIHEGAADRRDRPAMRDPVDAPQDPQPTIEWFDCRSPAQLDEVPADVVNLRGHDFDDAAVARLARFAKLQRLDLSPSVPDERGVTRSVAITDDGVAALAKLDSLRWLCLQGCWRINGRTLGALATLPLLEHLDLSHTGVKTSGVRALATSPSLRELDLSGCLDFHGSALAAVAELPGLRRLHLYGCASLSADDVAHLAKLSGLRHLDLRYCLGYFRGQRAMIGDLLEGAEPEAADQAPVEDGVGVTDTAVAALRDLPLEALLLQGCRALTDDVAASLRAMPRLRHVDLGDLPKTTTALLSQLPVDLQALSLSGDQHYDAAGLGALTRFGRLRWLDLTGIPAVDDALLAEVIAGKPLTRLGLGGTP